MIEIMILGAVVMVLIFHVYRQDKVIRLLAAQAEYQSTVIMQMAYGINALEEAIDACTD